MELHLLPLRMVVHRCVDLGDGVGPLSGGLLTVGVD